MRLKSYTGASMAEAMALVRAELGDDAIIVSTQRGTDGHGVRITAALEETDTEEEIHQVLSGSAPSPLAETIREALVYHGLPPRLIDSLIATARALEVEDPTMACAGALDEAFAFAALPERRAPHPFMLIGPAGSGKTVTVAKLAARARLAGRKVGVITADSVRAGALEQLAAFTSILDVELKKARSPDALRDLAAHAMAGADLVFIDTPGINPFSETDMAYLHDLIAAAEVEPVLVMAAGGDPAEAAEIAEAFARVGATRLLATRLDMTRRLGAILAAADAGQFMFCEVSITPHVANGLCPINPVSMARLLVPPAEDSLAAAPAPTPAKAAPPRPPPPAAAAAAAATASSHLPPFDLDALIQAGEEETLPPPLAEERPIFSALDELDPPAESRPPPRRRRPDFR